MLGPDRLFGHRKAGIGKCARRDADQVREPFGLPPQRRSAIGAEMKGHVAAAGRRAPERLGSGGGQFHAVAGEKGRDAEQRPGSPLAIEAMTERHLCGLAGAGEDKLAAVAGGSAFHGRKTYHRGPGKQEAPGDRQLASFIDRQAAPCLSALAPPPALLRLDVEAGHPFQKLRHRRPQNGYGSLSPIETCSTAYHSPRVQRGMNACGISLIRSTFCVPTIGIGRAGCAITQL